MRVLHAAAVGAVVVAACAPPSIESAATTTSVQAMPSPTSPAPVTSSTTTTTTAITDAVVELEPLGALGGGSGGNPVTTIRLRTAETYRFPELLPVLGFQPPSDHWEVRGYDRSAVRLRWRGNTGFDPGSLVVVAFAGRTASVEGTWSDIEAELDEGFGRVGTSLQWAAQGSTVVGNDEIEWRELRTGTTRPVTTESAPCVVTLFDRECVWFDSSARLLVVPVGDFSVPILVTEQMCDCDLGGLGSLRRDNELADHLDLVALVLEAISFED